MVARVDFNVDFEGCINHDWNSTGEYVDFDDVSKTRANRWRVESWGVCSCCGISEIEIVECDDGEWVKFEDLEEEFTV